MQSFNATSSTYSKTIYSHKNTKKNTFFFLRGEILTDTRAYDLRAGNNGLLPAKILAVCSRVLLRLRPIVTSSALQIPLFHDEL